jgi:hypothetical protein
MNENKVLINDYIRALSGQPKSPEAVAEYVVDPNLAKHIAEIEAAFPKYELLIHEMVAEGDRVVVRAEFRGAQHGSFAGIEATGKSVSAGLIIIYQVQNRKIVDHWMQLDSLSLLQQLQAAPAGASASATN